MSDRIPSSSSPVISAIFLTFGYCIYRKMYMMLDVFHIPDDKLVTGATRVGDPGSSGSALADLARLNCGRAAGADIEGPDERARDFYSGMRCGLCSLVPRGLSSTQYRFCTERLRASRTRERNGV